MNTKRFYIFLYLLFNFGVYADAFALVITSPLDGATVNEGDTVTIRVEPSPSDPELRVVQIFPPIGTNPCPELIHPPYECQVTFKSGSQARRITAIAESFTRELIDAPAISVFVRVTAILQGLRVTDNQLFLRVGGNEQLLIYGQYSDGVERHVEDPATGTTYQSSDPGVVTVDEKGLVTAIAPGKAVITVKNATKQLQIQVNVKAKKN